MGMTNGRTICSKHDEIMTRSEKISNLLSGETSVDSFSDAQAVALEEVIESSMGLQIFLRLLKEESDAIYWLAKDAKRDGVSMESGLDRKRTELRELAESLSSANERIAYLSSLLENNHD